MINEIPLAWTLIKFSVVFTFPFRFLYSILNLAIVTLHQRIQNCTKKSYDFAIFFCRCDVFYDLIIKSYFLRYNKCVSVCGFEVITGSQFIRSIPLFCLIHRFILFLSVRVCDVFTNDWRSLAPFCHSMGSLPFALYSLIYRQKFIKRENFCQRIFFKCGDKWWSTVDCCSNHIDRKFEEKDSITAKNNTPKVFFC